MAKKSTKKPAARSKAKGKAKAKVKAKVKAKAKAKAKARPAKATPKPKPVKKSTPAKAKPKTSPPLSFASLTTWKKLPTVEAVRFDFGDATNDSVHYHDTFGAEPEHLMVHEGSVKVAGAVALDGRTAPKDSQQTVYIIDGDLDIDGPLVFDQSDIATTLWVTGDVNVKRLACHSTAMLIVGGSLKVSDILVTDLEDAGHLIVHQSVTAPTWLDLAPGRGCIEVAHPPETRFLSDYYSAQPRSQEAPSAENDFEDEGARRPSSFGSLAASPLILPSLFAGASPDYSKIVEAVRAGGQILA